MWFEVNVRLSEVTDLKWPHGTEWQCGNSTLAMSWPNHVQILSFASMASRQGAVKHGFVSKIAGGCSSYDVIAPWPDLTWSFFFLSKVAQGLPHKVPQNPAALRAAAQGGLLQPPLSVRGLKEIIHLRHFSKTLPIIFTIQFFILFSETLIISPTKSWVSQNNRKVKKRVSVNHTQRHGASQSHSSCCELIGHRRPTDEVVRAPATTQRPHSSAGSEFIRCKFKFLRGVSEFSRAE